MDTMHNNRTKASSSKVDNDFWHDSMIQDYYQDYYQNLPSKKLDKEFQKDLRTLTNILVKLSGSERKTFIELLSGYIGFYLENRIEKEIDSSFFKILGS